MPESQTLAFIATGAIVVAAAVVVGVVVTNANKKPEPAPTPAPKEEEHHHHYPVFTNWWPRSPRMGGRFRGHH